jgi:uncharacterized SAM-binding protein YcdF (DUF218 family)
MDATGWHEVVALWLLPPGLLVLIALLGFVVYVKSAWAGGVIAGLSLALLVAFSLPRTAHELTASLETSTTPLDAQALAALRGQAAVIVVLGAGRYTAAPEYGGADTVSRFALERLRYAAYLYRRTGLPILLSGGAPAGEQVPEAEFMRAVLQDDYRITPRWLETHSHNTLENAVFTARLLQASGTRHVVLVTNAWHMHRALWCFKRTGLSVTAAPMGYYTLSLRERGVLGYIPAASGLYWTSMALRERLAYFWYRLSYGQRKAAVTSMQSGRASDLVKTPDPRFRQYG